jgi:fucose permease
VAAAYFVGAIAPTAMGALKQHYGIQAGMDMLACVAAGSGGVFLVTLLATRSRGARVG